MKNNDCAGVWFDQLVCAGRKPEKFEQGEPLFWDDPHISQSMLAAHLACDADGASRRRETIERTVVHLIRPSLLQAGGCVLDLGCGPGLYSNRLCRQGMKMTGIDISDRSIAYARQTAREQELSSTYICGNFFDLAYDREYDRVLQVYGELCTFFDQARNRLLRIIHKALKDNGLFIFDVSTRKLRMREGLTGEPYTKDSDWIALAARKV
ncbi:class I SAM-dependent methyltransferase [Sporomusa acidovorans]